MGRHPLFYGLALWFLMAPAPAQPPLHSLIWRPDDGVAAAWRGMDRPDPPRYCRPAFRDRLLSLATAARAGIEIPEQLARFTGWLDLIRIIDREPCTAQRLAGDLERWRADHEGHPAIGRFPGLFDAVPQGLRLGVLLPLQGEMAALSQMILSGMEAAAARHRIGLHIIDSLGPVAWAQEAFDCLIGPLQRQQVARVSREQPARPVLALNYLPARVTAPPSLFQMALRPEDEAYAVADLAAVAGHRRGLLFYVRERAWSRRMAVALQARWARYGGALEAHALDAEGTDFSAPLKAALRIADSMARRGRIEALLGRPVAFRPRRRQDIDFVVMLVDQRVGRMLKPQLAFWYAGDLPLYSTSRLLDTASFTRNRDLDGVRLTLPPWVVFGGDGIAIERRISLERSLYFLGESAVGMAQASHCLSRRARLADQAPGSAWVFDDATGRFHYRSRQALIRGDRVRYQSSPEATDR